MRMPLDNGLKIASSEEGRMRRQGRINRYGDGILPVHTDELEDKVKKRGLWVEN